MVKHIILWQLKDELTTEQKAEVKAGINASASVKVVSSITSALEEGRQSILT